MARIDHRADIVASSGEIFPDLADIVDVTPGAGDYAKDIVSHVNLVRSQLPASFLHKAANRLCLSPSVAAREAGHLLYRGGAVRKADIVELDLAEAEQGRLLGDSDIVIPKLLDIGIAPGKAPAIPVEAAAL